MAKPHIWRYDDDPDTARPWIVSVEGQEATDHDTWDEAVASVSATRQHANTPTERDDAVTEYIQAIIDDPGEDAWPDRDTHPGA